MKYKFLNIPMVAFIVMIILSCATIVHSEKHNLKNRKFQGIPSIAISTNGQLWAIWYAGITPDEDQNNYVVIATSGDDGKSWTEKLIIDPDGKGPLRAFDPELWLDPKGTLWLFWAETVGHDGTNAVLWAKTNNTPGKGDSEWSAPRRIANGIMMCKPTVLSTGEWVFPVSTWRETDNSAKAVVSKDKGKTFIIRGACNVPKEVRAFDEQMIVERENKSLWMMVRTKYGIGESISNDQGKTWSTLIPSSIQHPSARFFIRRLTSGNLLLVKHGPINERIGRSHLTAYISKDDGNTWLGGLLLDERNGVSYPDGQQRSDGTIHIIYDYSRTTSREILMAKFTEADVIAGDTASATTSLRMIVSKFPDLEFDSNKALVHKATLPNQNSFLYAKPYCNVITAEGISFQHPAMWIQHYSNCNGITVQIVKAFALGLCFFV